MGAGSGTYAAVKKEGLRMLPSLTDTDRWTEHFCMYKCTAFTQFQGVMCAEVIGAVAGGARAAGGARHGAERVAEDAAAADR